MRTILYAKAKITSKIFNYSLPKFIMISDKTSFFNGSDPLYGTTGEIKTPGSHTGSESETFNIGASSKFVRIDINDAGEQTIELVTGATRTAEQVCVDLQSKADAAFGPNKLLCSVSGGKVKLETGTRGASSKIDIVAVADDAYTVLGLTVGSYSGSSTGVGAYYNDMVLKIISEIHLESHLKLVLAGHVTEWVTRADAEAHGKKLQPNRINAGKNFVFTIPTTLIELEVRRFQKFVANDLFNVTRLVSKETRGYTLQTADNDFLDAFNTAADAIETEYQDEKTLFGF